MKIFLDTAETDIVRKHYKTGLIDGLTTNPTLIRKSGRKHEDVYQEFKEIGVTDLSMEVIGNAENMISDRDGIFVGWQPFKQFDLSAEMDSMHCVYEPKYDCEPRLSRGHSISGPDHYFPWFKGTFT